MRLLWRRYVGEEIKTTWQYQHKVPFEHEYAKLLSIPEACMGLNWTEQQEAELSLSLRLKIHNAIGCRDKSVLPV